MSNEAAARLSVEAFFADRVDRVLWLELLDGYMTAVRRAAVERLRVDLLDALAEPQMGFMPRLRAHDECFIAAEAVLDAEAAR